MSHYLGVLNGFIEDTCVLTVIAYLLARGRILAVLCETNRSWRHEWLVGSMFGAIGLTEVIFPGARAPYAMHSLVIAAAVVMCGFRTGAIAIAIVTVGMIAAHPTSGTIVQTGALTVAAFLIARIEARLPRRRNLMVGFVAGVAGQTAAVASRAFVSGGMAAFTHAAQFSIFANGFGVLLILFVVEEARTREDSHRHRLEAERAQSAMARAQTAAIRARVKPHFLYNAHTSIAALCAIDPEKAEQAILNLSHLMRRALESSDAESISVEQELEYVRAYLDIEQHRQGRHLKVEWDVAPSCLSASLPAFSIQTLVENAVTHGIAPKMEPGTVRIAVQPRAGRILIAIVDTGVGMTAQERRQALSEAGPCEHGLKIVSQQLRQSYERPSRLRLFTRQDLGTLAAFALPAVQRHTLQERTDYDHSAHRG